MHARALEVFSELVTVGVLSACVTIITHVITTGETFVSLKLDSDFGAPYLKAVKSW